MNNNKLIDFMMRIPKYSDNDLVKIAIFDAALWSPSRIGFDILANSIIDELEARELTISETICNRDVLQSFTKLNENRRKRLITELKMIATSGPILWSAPTFDDLMGISAHLNDYDSELFDLENCVDNRPLLPKGYLWGENDELLYYGKKGIEVVYPGIIMIKRILKSISDDSESVQKAEISFMCDGKEKLRILTLKELYNGASLQNLANYGAFVNSKNSTLLAEFFTDYVRTFRTSIDKSYTFNQIGWTDKNFNKFVPYVSDIEYDNPSYKNEYSSIIKSMGTYREWAALINDFRDNDHIPFRIILASSFASVLAEPLIYQPFFLYIQGRSQLGKTPALMVVSSVWANPDNRSGYIKDLAGSDEAIELGAQFYGSLPYCLNESQNRVAQQKGANIDNLVYLLGDGTPKTRGYATGGLRSQTSWCNAIIMTGEEDLTSNSEKLGSSYGIIRESWYRKNDSCEKNSTNI